MSNANYCADFGARLRKARIEKGMKQNDLAEAAGVSPQQISAYETKGSKPSVEVASAIAAELGISLDYLCGLDSEEKKQLEIKSFAGIIRHIAELSQYVDFKCKVEERDLPENEWEIEYWEDSDHNSVPGDMITTYPVAVITTSDHFVVDFFKRWHEIFSLYQKGVISDKLIESWYLGEIERLGCVKTAPNSEKKLPAFGLPLDR